MRQVILDLAITLDGYISGPNGETDWCILDGDMKFEQFLTTSIDTIFYGRVSYDQWGTFQPDENTTSDTEKAVWKAVHSKEKIAEFVASNIAAKVAEIKEKKGKDIWLYGGAKLIKSFIKLGLIDVYRLSVHPVALGAGKPLFENIETRVNLKLKSAKPFKSGVVQLIYEANAQN